MRPAYGASILLGIAVLASPPARSAKCPEVAGLYRPAGSGYAVADLVHALRITVYLGSKVQLEGRPEDGLEVRVTSSAKEALPKRPTVVLQHRRDFTCADGQLVFSGIRQASRKNEQGWYEGTSTVRIAPSGGGLGVEVVFRGSQREVLYSYDSARISVPKLGTGTVLRESLRWPSDAEAEAQAPLAIDAEPPPAEAPEVVRTRELLVPKLPGNVILATLRPSGDAVLATLTARRNEDVAQLEDRLRAAGIPHAMKVPPVWTNNAYYLQLLVWPSGKGPAAASRPSTHRVQQELLRAQDPMVTVRKVDDLGDGYVATVDIVGGATVESYVARLGANSGMFSDIRVFSESASAQAPGRRVARLGLVLR